MSDPYKIPNKLLEQINEHTEFGFILITMGSDGVPEFHIKSDNAIFEKALIHRGAMTLTMVDDVDDEEFASKLADKLGLETESEFPTFENEKDEFIDNWTPEKDDEDDGGSPVR